MADAPNDPKLDLKSRLGLKSRAAAPVAPIVPGAPPPEPDKPKGPTKETIEEARRRAAEAEKAAGPAVEQFQFAAPDHTPLPAALPSGPRVEYVEVKGSEELPGAAKKRRNLLIGVAVGAILVGLVIGRMMGASSARSAFNESVLLEAQAKQKLFDDKQGTFEAIAVLRAQLEKVDAAVRLLDPKEGDITTLEKDFADLLGLMAKFSNNKQSSLDPAEVMGTSMVNGELMKDLVTYAYATRNFQDAVSDAVEEAQTLFQSNPVPPPDQQKLFVLGEPDTMDVEGIGKVPFTKGTLVVQSGPAQPIQTKDAAGNPVTEYLQRVRVEGREDPVQIKTTQFVQVDMAPFWDRAGKNSKKTVLARLAVIASRLHDMSKKLDPKPVKAAIQAVLDKGSE